MEGNNEKKKLVIDFILNTKYKNLIPDNIFNDLKNPKKDFQKSMKELLSYIEGILNIRNEHLNNALKKNIYKIENGKDVLEMDSEGIRYSLLIELRRIIINLL